MKQNKFQPAYQYAAILLVIVSCVISFLLAILSYRYSNRFDKYDPVMLNAFIHFFSRKSNVNKSLVNNSRGSNKRTRTIPQNLL